MKIIQHLVAFVFFEFIVFGALAQSADYTQFTNNRLYINPAFAGTNICPRIILAARDKYLSMEHTYQSYYASYDQNVYQINFDLGGYLFRDDQMSVFENTQVGVIAAKGFRIKKKSTLKFGIQLNLNFESFDSESMTFNSMIDPVHGFIMDDNSNIESTSGANLGLAFGALYYTEKLYTGVSVYNITQPKSSLNNAVLFYRLYNLHFGYEFLWGNNAFKKDIKIIPNINYTYQYKQNMFNWGLQTKYSGFIGGIYNKHSVDLEYDSFVVLVGFEQKKFKFAYDCDIPLGNKSDKIFDTHEVTLTLYPGCGKGRYRAKAIKCPGF